MQLHKGPFFIKHYLLIKKDLTTFYHMEATIYAYLFVYMFLCYMCMRCIDKSG